MYWQLLNIVLIFKSKNNKQQQTTINFYCFTPLQIPKYLKQVQRYIYNVLNMTLMLRFVSSNSKNNTNMGPAAVKGSSLVLGNGDAIVSGKKKNSDNPPVGQCPKIHASWGVGLLFVIFNISSTWNERLSCKGPVKYLIERPNGISIIERRPPLWASDLIAK